jgi:calcium-dependent protein kinase
MDGLCISKAMFVPCLWGDIEQLYKVIKIIGRGSFSNVLLVKHKLTLQLRAAKRLVKPIEHLDRLIDEVEIMRCSDHPNIVRLFEVIENASHIYLIMEYCEGRDLADLLHHKHSIPEGEAAALMQQTISGLNYLHMRSICHRDLKLENLMLSTSCLKIVDFGLATICKEGVMNTKVGSCNYVGPEVLTGEYTIACDIWSLGVVLYALLCGRLPFQGRSDEETMRLARQGRVSFTNLSHVSSCARDLIARMLDVDPLTRISAKEMTSHPWLAETSVHRRDQDFSALGEAVCLKSFDGFFQSIRLRKLVLIYLASQIDSAEATAIIPAFRQLDKDHVGLISYQRSKGELVSLGHLQTKSAYTPGYSEPRCGTSEGLFTTPGAPMSVLYDALHSEDLPSQAQVGVTQKGVLSWTEFIAALMSSRIYASERHLWAAFKLLAVDNTNKLTVESLAVVLGRTSYEDKKFLEELFQEAGTDGEMIAMQIDFPEFVKIVTSNYGR